MKLGMLLHPDRGVDAVLDEARQADRQGFDSVWLSDHLMDIRGSQGPAGPLDSFTLMTAIGAVTSQVRLAWAMLNFSFHHPAVLAKRLATLDCLTHGRVICSIGAGWFVDEYRAYNLPWVEDHDERIEQEREVIRLLKELWTHPAPERVTFEGRYVSVRDLPFNPAPVQRPHPPIWIGGDSPATLGLVRELGDGWVMLSSGKRETLATVLSAADWPKRPMTLVRNAWIFPGETERAALELAERQISQGGQGLAKSLDEALKTHIIGSAEQCLARIDELESWGINYLRCNFGSAEQQAAVARLILPRLG